MIAEDSSLERSGESFGNVLGWRVFTDPISFWMERKMLQGPKVRAEAAVS